VKTISTLILFLRGSFPQTIRSPENMETLSKKEKRSESKKRKAKAFLQLAKEIEEVINFSSCPTGRL
jgi:hypothetical protein